MFNDTKAFSSFAVNDLRVATDFYGKTLGIEIDEDPMGIMLKISGGNDIFVYQKDDHIPAVFTILNFAVEDVEKTVDRLSSEGIKFEQYDFGGGVKTDQKGIMRGMGNSPDIAWFKDPAGNILSVLKK